MPNRVATPNLFAPAAPNWSLALLDQNAQAATGAINDSSLGAVNGPLADTGSANAYVVACALGAPSAYNNGMTVFFNPANTNTGASTLTVSPLASLPIVSAGGTALLGGEIQAGTTVGMVCDGSAFRIMSAPGQIYSVRLRSWSSIGNPNFEIDQRNVGNAVTGIGGATSVFTADRWLLGTSSTATMRFSAQQTSGNVVVPGTNYFITQKFLRITLTTVQASLAAADYAQMWINVEGPQLRELLGDVHSVSILVRSSVANLKFGLQIGTETGTSYSYTHLCSLGAANTWTLITIPAIPVWAVAGTWPTAPGSLGYFLAITLAAGSSQIASANDTWVTPAGAGAVGQSNFAASTVNSTIDFACIQHEPGSMATILMDKPFIQNYDECLRYYCKSYPYFSQVPTSNSPGHESWPVAASAFTMFVGTKFVKRMAKTPTVKIYSFDASNLNAVSLRPTASEWSAGTGTAATNISEAGFGYFNSQFQTTAGTTNGLFHYTADTGM